MPAGDAFICRLHSQSTKGKKHSRTGKKISSGQASAVRLAPIAHKEAPLQAVLAQPRGFCAGVIRAIEIVERALEVYGAPVYVFHEIVHNRHVVEDLERRGRFSWIISPPFLSIRSLYIEAG